MRRCSSAMKGQIMRIRRRRSQRSVASQDGTTAPASESRSTGTSGRRPASWWVWLSVITAVLVAATCGVVLWSFLPPVVYFPFFALAAWAMVILGAMWLVLTTIGWFKYRALRWSAAAPGVVVLTAALVVFSVPPTVAFAVSERSLDNAADHCTQSFESTTLGVYRVYMIQPVDGGCLFYIEGGLIQSIGFARFPDEAPDPRKARQDGEIEYETFDGDWYQFKQLF